MATLASSAMITLFVTPFDMIFFKMMAKTANMSSASSFTKIARDVYITQRSTNGSLNALGFAMGATFVRYVFVLTCINAYLNTVQLKKSS